MKQFFFYFQRQGVIGVFLQSRFFGKIPQRSEDDFPKNPAGA
jgi:hypothetical protein